VANEELKVKFLKGADQLSIPRGETTGGYNKHDNAYVYLAYDGNKYLMVPTGGQGRITRFWFRAGDVAGSFANEKQRQAYIAKINKAAGEVIAVALEAA
jgi:hypothetical protein